LAAAKGEDKKKERESTDKDHFSEKIKGEEVHGKLIPWFVLKFFFSVV
jgi:hypothetical protein